VGLCVSGCFTGTINKSPTVSIDSPTDDQIVRGATLVFKAVVHDDQNGGWQYIWALTPLPAPCADGDPIPTEAPEDTSKKDTFTTVVNKPGAYCISVSVHDQYGAEGHAVHGIQIVDAPPVASIAEVLPDGTLHAPPATVPLYTDLHLSSDSHDPDSSDALTPVWTIPASCSSSAIGPCPGAPADRCFTADQPGDCTVALTVTDGDGQSTTQQITIHVNDDRPPCIVETDPPWSTQLLWNPSDPHTLQVTVLDDDGDALPAPGNRQSMATFDWSFRVRTTDPLTRVVDPQLPSYTFAGDSFQLGQTVQIRVVAHDRVDRPGELDSCNQQLPEPPLVCAPTPGCNRWVTWTVEMNL
jgi:hypothetical protein